MVYRLMWGGLKKAMTVRPYGLSTAHLRRRYGHLPGQSPLKKNSEKTYGDHLTPATGFQEYHRIFG
jgi:hypothetical protein